MTMVFKKRLVTICVSFFVIIGACFVMGCEEREDPWVFDAEAEARRAEEMILEYEQNKEVWRLEFERQREIDLAVSFKLGVRMAELSLVSGLDVPAVLVDGEVITKREVEAQRVAIEVRDTSVSLKEGVGALIAMSVLRVEAARLGIEPSYRMRLYLEQAREGLETDGSGVELILAYIEGAEMTHEEFWEGFERETYNRFLRGAFIDYLEEAAPGVSLERYVDRLVARAEIEILDPELKELFPHSRFRPSVWVMGVVGAALVWIIGNAVKKRFCKKE